MRSLSGILSPEMSVRTIDGLGLRFEYDALRQKIMVEVTARSARFITKPVNASIHLTTLNGKVLLSKSLPEIWSKGRDHTIIDASKLKAGDYFLTVSLMNDKRELLGLLSLLINKPESSDSMLKPLQLGIGVNIRRFLIKRKLEILTDLTLFRRDAKRVRFVIRRNGKVLTEKENQISHILDLDLNLKERELPYINEIFDISSIPPGPIETEVSIYNECSTLLSRCVLAVDILEVPKWLGSKTGLDDVVPQPWTPVKVHDGVVECWGRKYVFKGFPFPEKIETAGASILSSPIRLKAEVDGKIQRWDRKEILKCDSSKSKATIISIASSENLLLKGESTIEFDGMIKIDLEVSSSKGRGISSLILEIPFKSEHAKFIHYNDCSWSYIHEPAKITSTIKLPFMPFVWLGDYDRGLMWFAESDEGLSVKDGSKIIEITPTRENGVETVLLKIHLIDEPQSRIKNFRMTFGLQATPVKPIKNGNPSHIRCLRIPIFKGMDRKKLWLPESVTYPAKGNINISNGTLEMWLIPLIDLKDEPPGAPEHFIFTLDGKQFVYQRFQVRLRWIPKERSLWLYYYRSYEYVYVLKASEISWRAGEPHHIAITWGDYIKLYIDGKLVASTPHRGLMLKEDFDDDKAKIILGSKNRWVQSPYIIDELKISSRELSPNDFCLNSEARIDDSTLLLDHFERIRKSDEFRTTSPARISSLSKRNGGVLSDGATLVKGKFGLGVRLAPLTKPKTILEISKELGAKYVFCSEDLVDDVHKHGLKAIVGAYNQYEIQTKWPIYNFKDEIQRFPGHILQFQPHNFAVSVCYNTVMTDFILEDLKRRIEESDIDGFYADGTSSPWKCTNEIHGCGYTDTYGNRKPTYPIFAVREMMKRAYVLFKKFKPDSLLFYHMSAIWAVPTLSFADICYGGEQFYREEAGFLFDLDKFRVEFAPNHWGLLCMYHAVVGPALTADYLLTLTTLHGSMISSDGPELAYKRAEVWRVLDSFGYEDAEWIPYWKSQRLVRCSSEAVKVSVYRKEGSALLIVANTRDKPVEASLYIDVHALGIKEIQEAVEARTGEKFLFYDGRLTVKIKPKSMLMILVS